MTFSTHDDVVSIIRHSGKSLHMKVVTPDLDGTFRTSLQLQKQVEIVPSSSSQRSINSTPRVDNSHKGLYGSVTSHSLGATLPRETVIDDLPHPQQPTRGGESPNLERLNKSGWDSSQDEATNTPSTPSHVQKFSYLHPAGMAQQHSPKKQPASPAYQGSSTSLSSTSESSQTIPEGVPHVTKSATLQPNQMGFLPASGNSSEDEQDESEFTKALKLGKEKLANSPAIRKRSNTLPSKTRNLAAQRARMANRGPAECPVTGSKRNQDNTAPNSKQPLVAALMRKIDSVPMESDHVTKSSDEDDSFSKTPPARSKSQIGHSEKAAPPAPKPKPQYRRAYTVDPRHHDMRVDGTSVHHLPKEAPGATGRSGSELEHREEANSDDEGSSGRMNWKSVLRPVKRTDSGRASPTPQESQRNRSNSQTKSSPAKSQLRSNEPVTNNLSEFAMESDHLPPPLPANTINNRLSIEFLDLPPPEDFMLLPGAETGETSTDLTSSPSLHQRHSRLSSGMPDRTPSPPPPPPPDSSPPREPLDHISLMGVKFPPLTKQAAFSTSTQDNMNFKVPSPIPSPMNTGSFETENTEPEAILPPNEFIPESEVQGNVGFQIPTPPGFEIPTPPTEDMAGPSKNGAPPDLDEAIRQLQLLSEDLTTAPPASKGASTLSKLGQDTSSMKPETVVPAPPESVTVSDAQVYPQTTRSRSSTSSSNVSSLNRYNEKGCAVQCCEQV